MEVDGSNEASDAEIELEAESQQPPPRQSQPQQGDMPDFIQPLRSSAALLARMAGRGSQGAARSQASGVRNGPASQHNGHQPHNGQATSHVLSAESSPLSSVPSSPPTQPQAPAQAECPPHAPAALPHPRTFDDVLLEDHIWPSDEEPGHERRFIKQQHDAQQRLSTVGALDDVLLEDLVWTSEEEAALDSRFTQQQQQQQQISQQQAQRQQTQRQHQARFSSAKNEAARSQSTWNELNLEELIWSTDDEASPELRVNRQQTQQQQSSSHVDVLDVPLDELIWSDDEAQEQAFVDTHDSLPLGEDDIIAVLNSDEEEEQSSREAEEEIEFDFVDEEDSREFERILALHGGEGAMRDFDEDELMEWD